MGNLLPKQPADNGSHLVEREPEFVEGISACMRPVEDAIRELARSSVPVLLLAEPGSGKHAVARRIHLISRQGDKPFRSLLCATLKAEDLAVLSNGKGLLGEGTLYLEEVSDLNASCQSRLLEALTEVQRGADYGRLICGSGHDLEAEVRAGRLREDLYYRISGVCLRIPPLRQRREDIPALLEYFLGKYAEDFHRNKPELSAETKQAFLQYSWPGNLRELEDAAKVLVVLEDQQRALAGLRAFQSKSRPSNGSKVSLKAASKAASREAERELILKALTRTQWNRRRAAKELQISYKALLYKLKQIRFEEYGAS
jgi:two-component system, NtrC family, response regulator AtoC